MVLGSLVWREHDQLVECQEREQTKRDLIVEIINNAQPKWNRSEVPATATR
jgi:hypothetical protein